MTEYTITGFIIGLVFVSLFAFSLGNFMGELQTNYGTAGNNTFDYYGNFTELQNLAQDVHQNGTDIEQQTGWLDVIGGFFSQGYKALKITYTSFDLFGSLLDQASADVPLFSVLKDYFVILFLVIIFIGIGITVLLKWVI